MRNIAIAILTTVFVNCTSNGNGGGGSGGSESAGGAGGSESGGGTRGSATLKGGGGSTSNAKGGSGGHSSGGAVGTKGSGGSGTGGTVPVGSGGTSGKATGGAGGTVGAADFSKAPGCPSIAGIVRDFVTTHSDFQFPPVQGSFPMGMTAMVEPTLGDDMKPVLTAAGFPIPAGIAASRESFKQWFNDAPGVNMNIPIQMEVKQVTATSWEFGPTTIDGFFFPINNKGFGNVDYVLPEVAGNPLEAAADKANNQLFTLEIHSEILYQGGKNELLNLRTDDDAWVFINNKLAIDDGGLNSAPAILRLDEVATKLGLVAGQRYPVSIFFADRQLVNAVFSMSSNVIWTGCAK